MKTASFLLVLVALTFVWARERRSAAQLEIQIAARRGQSHELARLQAERQRLLRLQPGAGELEKLRQAATEAARLQAAAGEKNGPDAQSAVLSLGEWSRAGDWKNRGNASPHAAIESALWAAAGGDVAAFKKFFVLSAAAREKASTLLAPLPPEARARFASADDLVAEFTIKSIPVSEAQLVWFSQTGDDDASACVFLQQPPADTAPPEQRAAALASGRAAHPEFAPPQAPETGTSAETYLSLHREADGWRIVVPVDAVTQIAGDLGVTPAP
ncbi:MAG TPA: hypothetical protein VG710_09355 [Opitutus sp.]|nr:hypothetical protein [Opitutus sp.]